MIDPMQLAQTWSSAQMTAQDPLRPGIRGINPALLENIARIASQGGGQAPEAMPAGQPAPQPGMGFTQAPQAPQGGGFGDFLGGIFNPEGAKTTRVATALMKEGVPPNMAMLYANDPQLLRGYVQKRMAGNDPLKALQAEKMQLEIDEMRNPKPPTTDDIREYNFAVRQGYDGSFTDYQLEQRKAGATNVTVGGGKYGTIPPGFELVEGPDGASMRAIPGGPAAMEAEQAAEQESLRKQQKTTATGVVTEDIGRAIDLIDKGGIRFPVTGFGANWASAIGGSEAADLKNLLDTVKANVGFDKLQAMREASPTGGALGQVSERENVLLQSVLGALEQSQSPEQLKYNLNRLNETILEIVHGPQWRDVVARQRLGGALEGGGNMGGAELNSWVADPGASIGGGGGVVDWQTYFGGM